MKLLVPHDSRPVSLDLPRKIAAIGADVLRTPPLKWLGDRDRRGSAASVLRWLHGNAGAGALFASLDFLLFGGLVFSREPSDPPFRPGEVVEKLRLIKELIPGLQIHAFKSVLRDSVTVRDAESLRLWKSMAEKGAHPQWFLDMRNRNHGFDLDLLTAAAAGVFDTLVFAKEDTAPGDPFRRETDELEERAREDALARRVFVTTGTDETALLLVARAAGGGNDAPPSFFIHPAGARLESAPAYENQPLAETIARQARICGCAVTGDAENASIEIIPHFGSRAPEDVFLLQLGGKRRFRTDPGAAENTLALVASRLAAGKRVALLDCAFINGGDAALAAQLLKRKMFFSLFSYAGWNTLANRSGCLIAHCAVLWRALQRAGAAKQRERVLKKHLAFMIERLAHDCAFSSAARGRLIQSADPAGNFDDTLQASRTLTEDLAAELKKFMEHASGAVLDSFLPSTRFVLNGAAVKRAWFPWNRAFEMDARIESDITLMSVAPP
ncbi:MAG: DUF4127 family protein [bacterium]